MICPQLKPCPFCGGEAGIRILISPTQGNLFEPTCKNTVCKKGWGMLGRLFNTVEEAVKAWNRRVGRINKEASA